MSRLWRAATGDELIGGLIVVAVGVVAVWFAVAFDEEPRPPVPVEFQVWLVGTSQAAAVWVDTETGTVVVDAPARAPHRWAVVEDRLLLPGSELGRSDLDWVEFELGEVVARPGSFAAARVVDTLFLPVKECVLPGVAEDDLVKLLVVQTFPAGSDPQRYSLCGGGIFRSTGVSVNKLVSVRDAERELTRPWVPSRIVPVGDLPAGERDVLLRAARRLVAPVALESS